MDAKEMLQEHSSVTCCVPPCPFPQYLQSMAKSHPFQVLTSSRPIPRISLREAFRRPHGTSTLCKPLRMSSPLGIGELADDWEAKITLCSPAVILPSMNRKSVALHLPDVMRIMMQVAMRSLNECGRDMGRARLLALAQIFFQEESKIQVLVDLRSECVARS
jgi:hypothetical protein